MYGPDSKLHIPLMYVCVSSQTHISSFVKLRWQALIGWEGADMTTRRHGPAPNNVAATRIMWRRIRDVNALDGDA